ncbi:hypothetical protein EB061_01205, partial [bacterium]|nr:hypothetical protein [bacterium]
MYLMKSTFVLFCLTLLNLAPETFAQSSQEITSNKRNFTLELQGEDAEALFSRLERKENKNDGQEQLHTKVGQAILCTEEKEGLLTKGEFVCSLSFEIVEGDVHEMYPIGETDTKAGLKNPKEYMGRLVEIKKGSTDALIRVFGSNAETIYSAMTADAKLAALKDGRFEPVEANQINDREQDGTLANVKTGKHVQCFQSVKTLAPASNCILTIETKTGKPKKAEVPGSSQAQSADPAPSPA